MNEYLRAQIYNTLDLRETEDLLEIWQTGNTEDWEEYTFPIIEEILRRRLGSVPGGPQQTVLSISGKSRSRRHGLRPRRATPEWAYLDERARILSGWPGYRSRPGRSGLDPLDSDFEAAHMEGVIVRLLFTRRFRTRNPVYLLLMSFVGFLFSLPLLFCGAMFLQGQMNAIVILFFYSPYWLVGVALLLAVIESISASRPNEHRGDVNVFF